MQPGEQAGQDQNWTKGLLVGRYDDPTGEITVRLVADSVTRRLLVNTTGLVTVMPEETDIALSDGVTVGSSSTLILADNPDRISATIVNDSDEVIYLALDTTAVMNSGIRINASGGSAEITQYTGQISGICTSGGKNVTVTEL